MISYLVPPTHRQAYRRSILLQQEMLLIRAEAASNRSHAFKYDESILNPKIDEVSIVWALRDREYTWRSAQLLNALKAHAGERF